MITLTSSRYILKYFLCQFGFLCREGQWSALEFLWQLLVGPHVHHDCGIWRARSDYYFWKGEAFIRWQYNQNISIKIKSKDFVVGCSDNMCFMQPEIEGVSSNSFPLKLETEIFRWLVASLPCLECSSWLSPFLSSSIRNEILNLKYQDKFCHLSGSLWTTETEFGSMKWNWRNLSAQVRRKRMSVSHPSIQVDNCKLYHL